MLVSIIVFLVFVAVFTLLFRATTQTIGQRVGEWVDRRHKAAEEIIETGLPPRAWIAALGNRAPGRESAAKRRLLRELRKLEQYFERSPLVDTEETRQTLVRELSDIRAKWKEAPPSDLTRDRP